MPHESPTTFHEIDALAAVIHDAKIVSCYMKHQLEAQRSKEPWGENRHAGTPNQPWHDIAIDQAKAVMEFLNETR